jgi:hypothetical protein
LNAKPQAIRRELRNLGTDTDAVFRPFDVTIVNTAQASYGALAASR